MLYDSLEGDFSFNILYYTVTSHERKIDFRPPSWQGVGKNEHNKISTSIRGTSPMGSVMYCTLIGSLLFFFLGKNKIKLIVKGILGSMKCSG